MMQKLFRVKEIAEITGENVQTVYKRIRGGEIESLKLGRRGVRVSEEALSNWLASKQPGGCKVRAC